MGKSVIGIVLQLRTHFAAGDYNSALQDVIQLLQLFAGPGKPIPAGAVGSASLLASVAASGHVATAGDCVSSLDGFLRSHGVDPDKPESAGAAETADAAGKINWQSLIGVIVKVLPIILGLL